jgi:3,4-dihydroxy-9,10-secoandrosta-1,3,5(10)-triene-9,17-dione 4,5-dioxygenase
MTVKALGYVVIETMQPEKWDHFLTQVAGVMRAPDVGDGAAYYRIDARPFRFRVQPGVQEHLIASAFEVEDAAALEALAARIAKAGRPVERASQELATARGVVGLIVTSDPAGNGLEFYHGDSEAAAPFVSPVGVPSFVTGPLGMGHSVLSAPDFEAAVAFYCDVVGLGRSDMPRFYFMGGPPEDAGMGFAFLHGSSGRHHSLALAEGPVPPSGCIHLMLELPNLTEVGKGHDRMRAYGYPESATLGLHVNDEMTSFYVQTPSGFDLEIGCGGLVIDPASWQTTHHEQISVWGHAWAWQEAMKKQAAE